MIFTGRTAIGLKAKELCNLEDYPRRTVAYYHDKEFEGIYNAYHCTYHNNEIEK